MGELTNLLWEDRPGQLRLSLTNTYHEWPVKGQAFPPAVFLSPDFESSSVVGEFDQSEREGDGEVVHLLAGHLDYVRVEHHYHLSA
jgi:hypothetical protein